MNLNYLLSDIRYSGVQNNENRRCINWFARINNSKNSSNVSDSLEFRSKNGRAGKNAIFEMKNSSSRACNICKKEKKNENGDRRGEWLDGEHTVSTRKRVNISV